jgi:hypothetical protein
MKKLTKKPVAIKIFYWWLPFIISQSFILGFAYLSIYSAFFGTIIVGLDIYFVLPSMVAIGVIGTSILLVRRYRSSKLID